jgi:hypothetical protein
MNPLTHPLAAQNSPQSFTGTRGIALALFAEHAWSPLRKAQTALDVDDHTYHGSVQATVHTHVYNRFVVIPCRTAHLDHEQQPSMLCRLRQLSLAILVNMISSHTWKGCCLT